MISTILDNLKTTFFNHPMVNMSASGILTEYENKSVKYPFVNIDLISSDTIKFVKNNVIRIHVIDRQIDPQVAYQKVEKIIDDVLKYLKITNYTIFYFTDDFPDSVSGGFVDIKIEDKINGSCNYENLDSDNNILLEDESYILTEKGELIKLEINQSTNIIYFGNSSQIPITSDQINSLPQKITTNSKLFNLNTGVENIYFTIAMPIEYRLKTVVDENNLWSDITSEFIQQLNIIVDNTFGIEKEYSIYRMTISNPYLRSHKFNIEIENNI